MKRIFNTTGTCIPAKHFVADVSAKVDQVMAMKEMRYCFPVNLPRKWIAARFPLKKVLASGGQGVNKEDEKMGR